MLSKANCSNYNNPVCLFYAISRLTDFSSGPFEFRLEKRDRGSAQFALSSLRAVQLNSLQVCD